MSYLALYRKYRPYTFNDVVGQEHIVRTLINQINSGRIAHAYLFCGSRGTGKTSIAKIFSRAVNCETPINGSACGECESCKKVNLPGNMNIIEIDAASHNGVDNIREINEEVKYTPPVGKYKVYIIDEVHMLSIGAFNALLKTLEEPPAHVIFILATTDPQKIPVTILSRCQRFDFKRIMANQIEKALLEYMSEEKIEIDMGAISYISRLADGAMRDALSLLEQSISFYFGEKITLEKVLYLVGAVDRSVLFNLIDAVVEKDSPKVLKLCDDVNNEGRSIGHFVADLLEHVRNLLVAKTTKGNTEALDYSEEYILRLREQANRVSTDEIMRFLKHLSELEYELRTSISPRILLEVSLLKLTEIQMDLSPESMISKVQVLEEKLERLIKMERTVQIVKEEVIKTEPQRKVLPTKLPEAVPDEIKELTNKWPLILSNLPETSAAKTVLASAKSAYIEGEIFYIIYRQGMEAGTKRYIDEVKDVLAKMSGKEIKVRAISGAEYANKSVDTYGSHPEQSEEVIAISDTLKFIGSKVNFTIEIK